MVEAIKQAGVNSENVIDMAISDFNSKLVAAMTKIEVNGATGKMTWTADGETFKTPKILKIEDGKTVVVD